MANKFGPAQLYAVEETVNQIADTLVHVGFEVGVSADEQNWDGKGMDDMSGVMDRLQDCERELARAVGLIRSYQMHIASRLEYEAACARRGVDA
jgi:hypothetical protein